MSDKNNKRSWPASLVHTIADDLLASLRPLCQPNCCCVAGSLRRGREEVHDLEILYVSRMGEIQRPGEMFASQGALADHFINGLLWSRLNKRLNKDGHVTWGNQNKLATHRATGLPIDFFATTWDNWFVSLVIRTGPKESNIRLIQAAKTHGLQLHAYGAFTRMDTGEDIFPRSEREVFDLCGVPWTEPQDR